tara:strand:- start:511 stop:732 length:222 start_codon:yes stop_codon:yes gene_type:complete
MGETAEERARRLRQIGGGEIFSRIAQYGVLGWSEDDTNDYERMLDEILNSLWGTDEPTVSLVKKYSKGSFKFV